MDAIKERKSVREFASKKPDWKKIMRALDAVRFAPMAGNQYSLKFILVSESDKIEKITSFCQQDFVGDAKFIVVVISEDSKVERSYGSLSGKFARQQAGAAIENFLLALTEQGLATCWVGYFEEQGIRETLGIPGNMTVDAVLPIGIENEQHKKQAKKSKPDLNDIMFFEKFDQDKIVNTPKVRTENA